MVKLNVLYGHPADPAAFDRYYHDIHIPLARQMRGWTGWTSARCQAVAPDAPPPYYLVVTLSAESRAAAEAILAGPEGQAALADVANFATGGVTSFFSDEQVLIPEESTNR